ncbi:hypothetical protein AV274_1130 [Blastocystis sp. ATCC 50177/Nand II]|uniref:Uncharacterized protein n=1 Tax=Blastocystis sp. subtype 1 (strain ATCC 50177 / NandII) TaxID=478820 RepID=A0A196SMJ0_BLAHN|nr:hypothetical protein AV274_1130 [Blastocystis sp. ATCC 50177/Nand II]
MTERKSTLHKALLKLLDVLCLEVIVLCLLECGMLFIYDQTVTHLGKFFAVVGTKAYRTLKRSSVVFLGYAVRFLIAYLLWSVLSIILRPVLIGFAEEFHILPKSNTDVACNEKEKQD